MHFEERILRLADGTPIYSRIWAPQQKLDGYPAVLLLHGVESHSAWFEEIAPGLTAEGIVIYAPDRSGWGASSGSRGHLESYDDAVNQIEEIAGILQPSHSEIHLAGLSWGGKLALYTVLRRPILFESLTMIAPGLVARNNLSIFQKIRVALGILVNEGASTSVPLPLKTRDFTKRSDRTHFIKLDPSRVKKVTADFCLESLKMDRYIQGHITHLRLPTQLLLAENDAIIDNTATEKLFSLAGSASKRVSVHENAIHSLVFETPERTAAETAEWILGAHPVNLSPKRVLIMGAGAVGSAVGGRLAWGGHKVTLVGREGHVKAVNEQGLCYHLGKSTRILKKNLDAVTSPLQAFKSSGEFDLIILCVKSFDTVTALEELRPVIKPGTPILSLQNGVSNEDIIIKAYPENPVIAGTILGYLSFETAGVVRVSSDRGGIALGPLNEADAPVAAEIQVILSDTGMTVDYIPDGRAVKWSKLMLNVAFNAINALTSLDTASIMRHPRLGQLAVATFAECAAVMRAQGIIPVDLPGYTVQRLARAMRLPTFIARNLVAFATRNEAAGTSSMAQDFAHGRAQTEIDEINGAVVAAAAAATEIIPTPANSHLIQLVRKAVADPELLQQFHNSPAYIAENWKT